MTELLPCPFCGGVAHIELDEYSYPVVVCDSEGVRLSGKFESIRKAAEAWNKRADSGDLIEKLEEIEKNYYFLQMVYDAKVKAEHGGA